MKLLILLFYLSNSDTSKTEYLFPCTWGCSCSHRIHKGWMVKKNGKYMRIEGERRDDKKTSVLYVDYAEENKK